MPLPSGPTPRDSLHEFEGGSQVSHSVQHRHPDQQEQVSETKAGLISCNGSAHGLHEWEFMALAKFDITQESYQAYLACKVMSSLRGDATLVAMEIGREKLLGTKALSCSPTRFATRSSCPSRQNPQICFDRATDPMDHSRKPPPNR